MAQGLNRVQFIGYLGREPAMTSFGDNTSKAEISIATPYSKKNSTGVFEDAVDWHKVVFYARKAELARDLLHKGNKIYVEGSLKTRKYTDKNGQERYITEVLGHEFHVLGGYSENREINIDKKQEFDFDDDIPY